MGDFAALVGNPQSESEQIFYPVLGSSRSIPVPLLILTILSGAYLRFWKSE